MPRSVACALLVPVILGGSLLAQRGGMPSRSSVSAGAHFRGSSSQPRDRFHHNRAGSFFYPYVFPYDEPYAYGGSYTEVVEKAPAPAAAQPLPPQPPPEPKVIEVPAAANQLPAKPLPPTIFILSNGERLESTRFLLRANDVSITVNRRQRTLALDELDLDATIVANRDRGIDFEIPADANEISLRF